MSTERSFRSTAVSAQLSDRMLEVLLAWVRTALAELETPQAATGAVMGSVRLLFEAARRYPISPLHMELEVGPGPAGAAIQLRVLPIAAEPEPGDVSDLWKDLPLPWPQIRVLVQQRQAVVLIEEIPAGRSRPKW